MAVSSHGSTFTFRGTAYTVTSVSVKAPTPEIVDMTSFDDPVGVKVLIPTGGLKTPGTVEIEAFSFTDPASAIGLHGELEFNTPGGAVSVYAICSDATAEARVGDVLRCRFSFTITDYEG